MTSLRAQRSNLGRLLRCARNDIVDLIYDLDCFAALAMMCMLLVVCLTAQVSHAACTVTDDKQHLIQLNTPVQRIISLAPDLTEIVFTIKAQHQLIATIDGSDFPAAANQIIHVGSYSGIDLEKIIALHPDLILVWSNNFSRQLSVLKKFGIPVYVSEPHYLEDIPRTMRNLGCLAGVSAEAKQAADEFTYHLNRLKAQYSHQQKRRVFYQIGSYSLFTVNHESWISQAISLCGGKNIFDDVPFISSEVSWESVLAANPDVILSDALDSDWRLHWEKWATIAAVKHHFLFSIHPDLIERASPRVLLGVERVCEVLQKARNVPVQ